MFRSIISQSKKPLELRALKLDFCTKMSSRRFRPLKEINEVKIVGTLTTDACVHQSGMKLLRVKTNESPVSSSIHTIHYKTETNLEAGLRLYVTGKLRSINSQTHTGKPLLSSFVKADKVFVLDNESGGSTDADVNNVKLLGYIATDDVNTHKHDEPILLVATNYKTLNDKGEEAIRSYIHRICAKDDNVRKYVEKTNLKRNDQIIVYGKISEEIGLDDKDNYTGCFIIAKNISKVDELNVV